MDLLQKRARYRRFWQPLLKGEGGYLSVVSPISDNGVLPYLLEPPVSLEEQWLSVDYAVKRAEADDSNLYYGLDAIHVERVHFGPGVQAAMLGAPYTLKENTVWFNMDPPIKCWDPIPVLMTDREHELYKAIITHTRALCDASKGRYAVAVTDIGGQMDVLYMLRGSELLEDLIDYPNEVSTALEKLDNDFIDLFTTLCDIIGPTDCGYTGWMPVISDVPWYPLQCDISVMISPEMFECFVLPSLDRISSVTGQSIYHLDGPGQIRHLDMLLSLKYIHAIQWVPLPAAIVGSQGLVNRSFIDKMSLDIYNRVLAAGKKLVLLGVEPSQVPVIFSEVGCDGVFIQANCKTRRDADELVAYAQKNWIRC